MMAWREEDGSPESAKSNLLSIGRRALISVLLGRRRLVGFTGSGLSLIYGGVTWQEGVNLILETTLDLIDLINTKPHLRPIDRQRLDDRKAMLESYYVAAGATTERLAAEDLLVAIELAEEARELLKSIRRRYQHHAPALLDRDTLRQISRLVDIRALVHGDVIGQHLQRDDIEDRRAPIYARRRRARRTGWRDPRTRAPAPIHLALGLPPRLEARCR
jgi:hypothetical protein